ncbi:type III polyketide synthase [Thermoplasmatales archaeon SW_10_69_26]|nr:MAG: type III polyketide synthase [Thermoplasmatales archaeon SW_10_69_26]
MPVPAGAGMPTLEALATATPDHDLPQDTVRELAASLVEDQAPEHEDVLRVFDSAGIEQRSIARPLKYYLSSPGWSQRSKVYEEVGTDLAAEVTRGCLAEAEADRGDIDGIVFVTTTGLATPSLETALANRLDLDPSILRVPVWGLGCAGGVAGLARAADLARAHPEGRLLAVSVELCSLAFMREELSKKMIVASALFGDGAAGALVAGDDVDADGPKLRGARSHQWPDTGDVMGWEITDRGLGVVFSPEIPDIVASKMDDVVPAFLDEHGTTVDEARVPFHPGGPKVVDAYEEALGLPEDAFTVSREVLRDHGNMSSPTALFVLKRSLAKDPLAPGEDALVAAVGPGFAAELALVTGA